MRDNQVSAPPGASVKPLFLCSLHLITQHVAFNQQTQTNCLPMEKKTEEENFNEWDMKMSVNSQRLVPIRYFVYTLDNSRRQRLAPGPTARNWAETSVKPMTA